MGSIYSRIEQETIDYKKIADLKVEEYGTKLNNYIGIIINQYKDRTHFIFELLQNAEDAHASKVDLRLYKDRFEIIHDGFLFVKKDVIAITEIADSSKDDGAIGRFGIGFKSVYAYTKRPVIYSGLYNFAIENFVNPVAVKKDLSLKNGLTKIVIPFTHDSVTATQAFNEISRALKKQITANSILFLKSVQQVCINIEGEYGEISLKKREHVLNGSTSFSVVDVQLDYKSSLLETNGKTDSKNEFLLFGDMQKNEVNIAFYIDGQNLRKIRETNIFTFFPTDKESHQRFYIHAPFATTPARDNIIEDNIINAQLVDSICLLLHKAILWLRDKGYLTIEGMNAVYPIYRYPEDTIFRKIYEKAIDILKSGEAIIPAEESGRHEKISNICFPETMGITDVFTSEDLHSLVGPTKSWIAKEIVMENYAPLRSFFRENFKDSYHVYTWKSLVDRFDKRYLESKSIRWFEKLFKGIRNISTITKSDSSHAINVSGIPFVRLSDGRNITAFTDGNPNVYINNPTHCNLKIADEYLNNSVIFEYYVNVLRVPEYNLLRIVTDEILPKYAKKPIQFDTKDHFSENKRDLKQIKKVMSMRRDINIQLLAEDRYLVTDGDDWYRPCDVHIPEDFMSAGVVTGYDLVSDKIEFHFLDNRYQNDPALDEKFFNALGCSAGLKMIHVSDKEYHRLLGQYVNRDIEKQFRKRISEKNNKDGFDYKQSFEGFSDDLFLKLEDKKSSFKIAAFINRQIHRIDLEGRVRASNNKNMSGNSADSMDIYSAIGIMLNYIPWIYRADGVKCSPNEMRRGEVDPEFEKKYGKVLNLLEFKEEDTIVETLLERYNTDEKKALKKILEDQDTLKKVMKMLNRENRSRGGQQNIEQGFVELEGNSGSGAFNEGLPEADAIKNKSRREQKIEEEFQESMNQVTTMKDTRITYTFRNNVSKEEKQFLESEYNGVCQICQTVIMSYHHTPYFEAINMLKTSNLTKEVNSNIGNGWNSLCLCPNCAAKYRYGIKDMRGFKESVVNARIEQGNPEHIQIEIGLQNKREHISYTPKHLLSLQKAIEFYKRDKHNEDDDD